MSTADEQASTDPRRMLHPELSGDERRRLFLQGIELFNRGRFFDCHEAFEEIWRSTSPEPRDLFQGLIQVAVGLHHWLERGNARPAARILARGRRRLEPFAARGHGRPHGLDLAALLHRVEAWKTWLTGERGGPPPEVPRLVVVDRAGVR